MKVFRFKVIEISRRKEYKKRRKKRKFAERNRTWRNAHFLDE
jgi:hypothetical protein